MKSKPCVKFVINFVLAGNDIIVYRCIHNIGKINKKLTGKMLQ